LKVWRGHCQLGGSLQGVYGLFPYLYDMQKYKLIRLHE
jgi:hypothetical protein